MEANQRNAMRTATVALPSDTNGGEPEERNEDGNRSLAVGHEWRRTRGTHGGRQKYCRPVAMEAICQPGYYVRRRAWAVFPKSDAKRGQPSSGRWRQENAAGEAAERISALSGIGAGMITYESMAMAAGEDDADKFKSGGVLTCSASVQDSGRGSLYKYQAAVEDRYTNTRNTMAAAVIPIELGVDLPAIQ